MRKLIVLDTETAPCDNTVVGVDVKNMFVYDVAWAVCDRYGNVYKTRNFINSDVFFNEDLMNSAYYAHKIPQYLEQIENGESVVASLYTIRKTLIEDLKEDDITEIYCHNARFDYNTLNNTQRYYTKSKYRYFFPKSVTICDSLKMSRDVIAKMPTYKRFCEENNYLTKNGKVKLTAEVLYRFISKDNEFVEEHKGLQDVLIEKDIVAYCYKQHKKMRKTLY